MIELNYQLDRVVEECAELVFEIQKAKRFGLHSKHEKYNNIECIERIKCEIEDLDREIFQLESHKDFV